MKKLSMLMLCAGLLAIGCKKDPPAPEAPYVRFGQSSLQLAPIPGAEAELTVESNIAWKLNTGADFDALLEIDKKQGSGNTTIHLKTRLNATTENTVTINLVTADKPDQILATLTVTQKPYNPQIEITKYYGGDLDEYANAVVATPDGGVIIAGNAYSRNNGHVGNNHKRGSSDFWLVKLNSQNDTVWTKLLGGDEDEYATAICKTSDGYVVAGTTFSHQSGDVGDNNGNGNGTSDFWVVKFKEKADGKGIEIIWKQSIGTDGNEFASAVTTLPNGGIVVAGKTEKVGGVHDGGDFYSAKLDGTNGGYTTSHLADVGIYALAVAASQDGSYLVAGYRSNGAGGTNLQVAGYNSLGELLFLSIGGIAQKNEVVRSVIAKPGGGYILAGSSERTVNGIKSIDCFVSTFVDDELGDPIYFGGSGYDEAMSIVATNDGGYILTGHTTSGDHDGDVTDVNQGDKDYWIIKLNSNFQKLWDKSFGTAGTDVANAIAATTDGKYVVAGYSPTAGKLNDYGILKIKDH